MSDSYYDVMVEALEEVQEKMDESKAQIEKLQKGIRHAKEALEEKITKIDQELVPKKQFFEKVIKAYQENFPATTPTTAPEPEPEPKAKLFGKSFRKFRKKKTETPDPVDKIPPPVEKMDKMDDILGEL